MLEKPKVVSLFSGCGGSSLGYELAGFEVIFAVECDKNAQLVYATNHPKTYLFSDDIKKLSIDFIFSKINLNPGELDLLDGSPPCQGFSTAGKRQFTDERNDLFLEYARILEALKPKTFIMENVPGMIKGIMKLKFKQILEKLISCGYVVKVAVLNAANYGVPQNRERLIFVGIRNDIGKTFKFPQPFSRQITVKQALADCPDYCDKPIIKEWQQRALNLLSCHSSTKEKQVVFRQTKGTTGSAISMIILDPNKPCPTITKSEIAASGLIHPNKKRYLNLSELKRLSSFPDDYWFLNRESGIERIGNAVPPLLIKAIAEQIKKDIYGQKAK